MSYRRAGISLDAITAELVIDGVKLFADAADKLYGAVAYKRATSLGGGIDGQKLFAWRRAQQDRREEQRGVACLGENPKTVAEGQVGVDRR